jgi:dethiobiotin synthetase
VSRYFVTATGTELGKTFTSAALLRGAKGAGRSVAALKPVASGIDDDNLIDSDPAVLLAAQDIPCDWAAVERICPWHFRAPLSPDMAAAREGRSVPFEDLLRFCRATLEGPAAFALVEGVGGIMAPIDARHTVLDWVAALEIPVPPAETAAAIARFAPDVTILHVPRLPGPEAWRRVPLYDALMRSGRTSAASTGRR